MSYFNFSFVTALVILTFILPNKAGAQSGPAFASDDFSAFIVDPTRWTFINPRGDATLMMTGAQAWISVPAGSAHDMWNNLNSVPRIKQPANDTDFEIEIKFESPLRQLSQQQGVFIEEDSANFLRFNFYNDGLTIRNFAAVISSGAVNVKTNRAISRDLPLYMRVKREATQWTQSYSYDGVSWHTEASFTHALRVSAVGAFVGNAGIQAPAHTGVIDYFFNTAAPIAPEDGGRRTLTTYVVGDGKVVKSNDQPTYLSGEAVEIEAIPDAGLSFYRWSDDLTGSENPMTLTLAGDGIVGAIFTANDDPAINVWYGPKQVFGRLGVPQRGVNILGNVSDYDGIASLTYSLNAAPPLPLSIGPLNPRLTAAGDFNIDLPYAQLAAGQNQVVITATDHLGNAKTETVEVEHVGGNTWPAAYTIDWRAVTKVQEVVQIVDGLWTLEENGIRTAAPGYDRLLAIGDTTWKDYEVTVPVTIHRFDFQAGGAVVGILMRWKGHYDWGNEQPDEGWWPMGAAGVYQPRDQDNSDGDLEIFGDESVLLAPKRHRRLELNVRYMFKMRVETTPASGGFYQFKVWPDGQPEPSLWDLSALDATDLPSGSFLLAAHNTDASFGNVTVVPVVKVAVNTAAETPTHFELHPNYPNPLQASALNPETTIEFSLPTPGFVTLKIFTAKGEEVAVLIAAELSGGRYKTAWNAKGLPSGVYFCRLSLESSKLTAPFRVAQKLLLIK